MPSSPSDDPIKFYYLASWLNSKIKTPPISEVSRVIIGRAYYAAFLAARDQARETGTGARVHQDVINHYRDKNTYVSNKLADLKRLREQADYELNKTVSCSDVNSSLKGCRAILLQLKLLKSDDDNYPQNYAPLDL